MLYRALLSFIFSAFTAALSEIAIKRCLCVSYFKSFVTWSRINLLPVIGYQSYVLNWQCDSAIRLQVCYVVYLAVLREM